MPTEQQINDGGQDLVALGLIVNGDANRPNPGFAAGTVLTRTGQLVRTAARAIADISASFVQVVTGTTLTASSLIALQAVAAPSGPAYIFLFGRTAMADGAGGSFVFQVGDQSANVALDSLKGIWVAPNSDPTGASGAWQRQWDGIHGRPEWFGAVVDTPSADNRSAFDACLALCPVMQLGPFDYWVQGRWQITRSYRQIVGVGRTDDGGNAVTRVLLSSATQDVLFIGTDTSPGSINNFTRYVSVENVAFFNVAAPVAPSTGRRGGPAIVHAKYALNCYFRQVYVREGTHGFLFEATVYSRLDDCAAQRTVAGPTTGNDFYSGCTLDGILSIGANTGIASFYVDKLNVSGTTNALISYAVYTIDGFTDIFLRKVETSGVDNGIVLNGNNSVAYGSEDCWVQHCILDQVDRGIVVAAGGRLTSVTIESNRVTPRASTPGGAIAIDVQGTPTSGQGGSIALLSNQLTGIGGGSTGINVKNSTGVWADANIITDINNPVTLESVAQSRIVGRISNPTQTVPVAAVAVKTSARVVVDVSVDGNPAAFATGVNLLGNGNSVIEVRLTGIDAGAISGGAANKLVSNGAQITAAGPFGNNSLAQGIAT